jgi:transcriptional regulator with XRE-family HTH domain
VLELPAHTRPLVQERGVIDVGEVTRSFVAALHAASYRTEPAGKVAPIVAGYSRSAKFRGNIIAVAGNNGGGAVMHFGRHVRKERAARGWSIHELSSRTGIAAGHLSRIENGKRPPTENVAQACDHVFPERKGWFREYYEESRTWAPAGFRDWPEYENKASTLRAWSPGILHGLLQTEAYARAVLDTSGVVHR